MHEFQMNSFLRPRGFNNTYSINCEFSVHYTQNLNVKLYGKIDRIFAMHAHFVSYLLSYSVVADAARGKQSLLLEYFREYGIVF